MKKRILALLLTLCMVLSLVPHTTAHAEDGNNAEAPQAAVPAAETMADSSTTVLAFSSDVHNGTASGGETNVSALRMNSWLDAVNPKYNNKISVMGFCGDMAAASSNQTTFWTFTQTAWDKVTDHGISVVCTTGNHEYSNGQYGSVSNDTRNQYILNGQGRAVSGENYRIYCLGANSSNWGYDDSQATALTNFMNSVTDDKPTIILTHFPLHYYSGGGQTRTTTNAIAILNAVNNAAVGPDGQYGTSDDKKIIFLWGHNHTVADSHYDHIYLPEDTINYSNSSSSATKIYFYYAAAGSMADTEYGQSGQVMGKGLILTIDSSNKLAFQYYDKNGNAVSDEHASYTEQDPVGINSVTITAEGNTFEVLEGRKLQLGFTTDPDNATTKTVTWSSSNENVATVDSTGLVKGKNEGTTVITLTVSDGITRNTVTATKTITVAHNDNPAQEVTVDVTPSTSNPEQSIDINVGDTLIVNVTNGSSNTAYDYSVSFSKSGIASVDSTSINIAAGATAQFTFTGEADGKVDITIKNNQSSSSYVRKATIHLTVGDGSSAPVTGGSVDITPTTDSPEESATIYVGDTLAINVTNSSSNSAYDFTASLSNSGIATISDTTINIAQGGTEQFIVTGVAVGTVDITIQNNNSYGSQYTRKGIIHLTVAEVTNPVAVTGVTVSPTSQTIEARKTVQLTATVAPSDATNKKVSWTSSNTNVATVDENGKVKGVAEGTATITVTTADGGFTATATITVTPSTVTETQYVIVINDFALTYDRSPNTANGGSSSYTYTGLAGVAYDGTAPDNARWIFEETSGGYYIKDLDGNYLNATYTSGSNSGKGDLKLDSTPDVWVLDSGYSLESGTVNGSKLKSTNASGTATSDKFLGYEDEQNLFTVRSSSNADEVTIEEAGDPVAVTGVSLDKHELSLSAGQTGTLTATVTPANATNKAVTWTSSAPTVATVSGGVVTALAEGTAVITVKTTDGGFTDTCTVTVTPAKTVQFVLTDKLEDGKEYLIVNANTGSAYAVSNTANGSKTLKGVAVTVVDGVITITETAAADITFTSEGRTSTSGTASFWLSNGGQYLYADSSDGLRLVASSTQTSSSNSAKVWHYKADGKNLLWFFKDENNNDGYSDTSSTYKYFLEFSNGNFTDNHASTTNLANTNTPAIYLFVKSDQVHIHTWSGPEWVWTGDVTTRAAVTAKAVFTCTDPDCPEKTREIDATVTETTESGRTKYTASVTFNGQTYTDVRYEKQPLQPGTIEITADKTLVLPGDEVTFTVTLGPISNMASMQMEVVLPTGLAFVSATKNSGAGAALGYTLNFCENDTMVINAFSDGAEYTSDSNLELGTFVCRVGDSFTSGTVTLDDLEFYTFVPEEIPVTVTPVTLTKAETYTITYDLAGGTLPEGKTNPTEYTALSDAFTLVNPEKEGYTFAGWTGTDLTAATTTVTVQKGSTGNRSYTATWTPVEYTITYNLNGGTNASANPAKYTIETATITLADPTRDGYVFGGWYTTSDFTGDAVTQIAKGSTGNVTLYAKWAVKTWTITFNNYDGTLLKTQEVADGSVPVYDGETPTREGTPSLAWEFTGWDPELTAATKDATYTAVFKQVVRTFTVTWKNYDGTVLEVDEGVEYGTRPTYNGEQPTRPSTSAYVYTFDGWTPDIVNVTADATYTAKFKEEPNLHKITGSLKSFTITAGEKTYGEGTVTVELFEFGTETLVTSTTATGTDTTYELTGVAAGFYTLKVSKADHAARTYRVTVGDADAEQDVKIHLLGDVNGDGKVTTIDLGLTNWYATGQKTPDDYQFACADVNENNDVTTVDVAFVNSHAKKMSILWEALKAQP